jgi:CRISPR-associated endonuclease Csn1
MELNCEETVWAFDLGKGSIGEAVRQGTRFLHKESLLIPPDFARRGPATLSGTPASRYRAMKTREAHRKREEWLEKLWTAAGLQVLQGRQVRCDQKTKEWLPPILGDERLEREFAKAGDDMCYTSSLLRIKLLQWKRGEPKLAEWQVYKALRSAIQKRGYAPVPWEKQRADKRQAPSPEEETAFAEAKSRWDNFAAMLKEKSLGEEFHRPCYYDAYHLKLWNPERPTELSANRLVSAPNSTQQVIFPGRVVQAEVLALAEQAANQLPQLNQAFAKIMDQHRQEVRERVAAINARRAEKGKLLIHMPSLAGGAKDFAELLAFGVGGQSLRLPNHRPIASFDPTLRRDMGLHPGSPSDHKAALGQKVARFENRLRAECALIGRSRNRPKGLAVCRNTCAEDLRRAISDEDVRLLPAQVTFLMKLKNLRVEDKTQDRKQHGLAHEQIAEVFNACNPKRKYHLTHSEWARWCAHFDVLPVAKLEDKVKAETNLPAQGETDKPEKGKDAVERPATEGRCRFSRPALRILKELILSGKAPSVFHGRLVRRDPELLSKLGTKVKDKEQTVTRPLAVFDDSEDQATNAANCLKGLLVSDLAFLTKMRKDDAKEDSWDGIFIPSRNLDQVAAQAEASPAERRDTILALIGQQNNPIVRHRLSTFWERLQKLEKRFGAPGRIVLELVRGDPESSWLGEKAKEGIRKSQDDNRQARNNAKQRLAEMKLPSTERNLLKYLLWESQGGQCLYGLDGKLMEAVGDDGKSKAKCLYVETALPWTGLESYRVDHVVPRAAGGPDAFHNLVLTTDDTNARKGDRTPYQWFRDDRSQAEWQAYRTRVLSREKQLGGKKVRLLLSADAEQLVQRYTPLAETAWIARLAQTIAGLHFGWVNGVDAKGVQRIVPISGGLTGRVRRQYYLNTLTGPSSDKDLPQDKEERRAREKEAEADRNTKNRRDRRHHALDAMVLSFLEGWVNDPGREDEFRFTELGDKPCYQPSDRPRVFAIKGRIEQLQGQFKQAQTVAEREGIQTQITSCRDQLAKLRQPRDWRSVREWFRRQLEGSEHDGTRPLLPVYLHYPKSRLEAMLYRGVWLPVEDEQKASLATVENYDKAFKELKMPLVKLAYLGNRQTGKEEFSVEHGLRQAAVLVAGRGFDSKALRQAVEAFLNANPDEATWQAFCRGSNLATLFPPRKKPGIENQVVVYRLAEKRTQRAKLLDLGLSNEEIPEFDAPHFEMQVSRLVVPPERPKDRKGRRKRMESAAGSALPAENTQLQDQLRRLRLQIEEHFRQNPPYAGKQPRKPSERTAWEQKRKRSDEAWDAFLRQTGLDRHKRVYLRTDEPDPTATPFEKAGLRGVLLAKARRFDPSGAEKQAQSVSDPWLRFQLREFLKRNPGQQEWKDFCGTFVQVTRDQFRQFVATGPQTAAQFVEFYKAARNRPKATLVRYVQQVIGDPDEYVDVSKDSTGIYAKGGNSGYLTFTRVLEDKDGKETCSFGAVPVRCFQNQHEARHNLLREPGVSLYDAKLWRTDVLLQLPQEAKIGKQTLPRGYYYFGSISNGRSMTLKPLKGGDNFEGISVTGLLAAGLKRVEIETL